MTKIRIVLTGGGTAGHVTPNLALLEILFSNNWDVDYIGSINGVEKNIIESHGIPYYKIRCGKLRRYFSWQNFLDPFNILLGVIQAHNLLRKLKVNVIFSKGGFVSLPVVIAGYLRRIPIVIHESDMTPGLANRLSFPFASKICLNFEETKKYIKHQSKVQVTGTPIRRELFNGSKDKALELCGFDTLKPCLLVIGGSQGSVVINRVIRDSLEKLTKNYQVIHICGKNNICDSLKNHHAYYQIEYANEEIADLLAASDIVVSRSGANSLCELLAFKKPHVLIPLSSNSSRGDQIQNANFFAKKGISVVINEADLNQDTLLKSIQECKDNSENSIKEMDKLGVSSASNIIFKILDEMVKSTTY